MANIDFNFITAYTPPRGDRLDLDFEAGGLFATDLEVEYQTDLWASAPTDVYLLQPRFRATYINTYDSGSIYFDVPVTGVSLIVERISDSAMIWVSGVMDFEAMDIAGTPILPPGVHELYPGEVCTVPYNINSTGDPLFRDGESYNLSLRFYSDYIDPLYSNWVETTFGMFELVIEVLNPEVTITYTTDPPPSGHMIDGTWATDPTNVRPIKPWFRGTYHSSLADIPDAPDEYVVTAVWIEVRDTSPELNLVWQSGYLDFTVYDNPPYDTPILPEHAHVLRSGGICELPYQFDNDILEIPTALLKLPRDGASYTWRMRFYCGAEGVPTNWSTDSPFGMFEDSWTATSLLCEGEVNPTGVTNITPNFDSSFHAVYTEFQTPLTLSYRLQVSGAPDFLSDLRWDTSAIETPPISPDISGDFSLETITYAGGPLVRNASTLYWRIKLFVRVEWGDIELDWFSVQNFEMFDEVCSTTYLRVDSLVEPLALKNYHPEFTAVFSNNYPLARATHVQLQVCLDSWAVKWDSDWVSVDLEPEEECLPVLYPSPYPLGDTGFFFDNTPFKFKMRFRYESDGTYTTNYTESLFTMGEALVEALYPKIDGAVGNRNVLSFTPQFSADYTTDAYNSVEKDREYCKEVWIQVFSDAGLTTVVWNSGWVSSGEILDDNPLGGVECNRIEMPDGLLVEYTRYWWHIRFKNERNIEGDWSGEWWFDCLGYSISDVAQTDVINGFWESKEYEFRVVSRDNFISFYLKNLTDDIIIYNSAGLNRGGQPRILFNSTTGMITLMFISNGKLYSREWLITDLPETAPLTAPQLVDGTLEAYQVLPLGYDLIDLGTRPFPPTIPILCLGSICSEDGNLYPEYPYIVTFTSPLVHPYFEEEYNIKVYVDNGVFDSEHVINYYMPFVPASMLGVDISNEQVSKVASWLPDRLADEIESIKVRALYLGYSASAMINKLESSIGNEVSLQDSVHSTIQIWKYKESVRVSDDLLPPIIDSDSLALNSIYVLDQVWAYKEAVHVSEDILPMMSTETESPGVIREDVVGDYIYGQNYTVYKYYSANIR